MTTKATQRQARYDEKNSVRYSFKFNRATDADLVEALDRSPNKQALVKMALREFIRKGLTSK